MLLLWPNRGGGGSGFLLFGKGSQLQAGALLPPINTRISPVEAGDSVSFSGTLSTTSVAGGIAVSERQDIVVIAANKWNPAVLNILERRDTPSFSAIAYVRGSITETERRDTVSIAGKVTDKGTLVDVERRDTVVLAGTVTDKGVIADVERRDTLAVAGKITDKATLAVAERKDTLSLAGTVGSGVSITGTLAATNRPDTAASVGKVVVRATTAVTERKDAVASVGKVTNKATLAVTDRKDSVSISGGALVPVVGTLASTSRPDVVRMVGTAGSTGWDTSQGKAKSNIKFTPIRDVEVKTTPAKIASSFTGAKAFASARVSLNPMGLSVWIAQTKSGAKANAFVRTKKQAGLVASHGSRTTADAIVAPTYVVARVGSCGSPVSAGASTAVQHHAAMSWATSGVGILAVKNPTDEEMAAMAYLTLKRRLTARSNGDYTRAI